MAHLEPGQRAGDQEAGRTENVGTPDMMPRLRRADGRPDGDEGADVELDGPHELHGRGEPVDPAGQEHENLTAGGTRPPGRGVDRLPVLQEAGRGEEQRPGEERRRVGPRAHGVRVRGHCTQREQERADGEQHAYPPVAIVRRPPGRAARRGSGQVLAVRARFPARDHPVRAPADDEGDERPEPAFLRRLCLGRHQRPSASAPWLTAPRMGQRRADGITRRGRGRGAPAPGRGVRGERGNLRQDQPVRAYCS
jgi:hypothetical protein